MTTWLILTPIIPAAAALAIAVLPSRVSGWLATAAIAASAACIAQLSGVIEAGNGGLVGTGGSDVVEAGTLWMRAGSIDIHVTLRLDGLSWWTAALVAGICLLVTVYSIGYIEDHRRRFFALMTFFAASMLTLVLAGSFPLLFLAWEGVGVASFALIAFDYRDEQARAAASKAFLMTRFGDFGLLVGWLLVLVTAETTLIHEFLNRVEVFDADLLLWIALLAFVAVVGKCAQLPLSAWLPDAMAGPTPVSALLHSATMVAAGVYLLLRLFPLFEALEPASDIVLWVGAVTAVAGALVATSRFDLKRLLAWSTVSQLGEMVMAVGFAAPIAAAFHLTTHGVFKSALFLAAGAIERETGTRDLRELSRRKPAMPMTAAVFAACGLALAGFPLFSGFWSEEKILGAAAAHGATWGAVVVALVALAGTYIGRAFFAAFDGKSFRGRSATFDGEPFHVRAAAVDGKSFGGRSPELEPQGGRKQKAGPSRRVLLLLPMIVLGIASIVLGFYVRVPIEHVLPFAPESHSPGIWRWLAVAASIVGLSAGALRARAAGAAPALGTWTGAFAALADGIASVPPRLVLQFARWAAVVERLLDRDAAGLGRNSLGLAHLLRHPERGIDGTSRGTARAVRRAARLLVYSEAALDASARGAARGAVALARGTDAAERLGFASGIDRAAHGLRSGGGYLSRLETGQIFRYTLSLFVWVLVAVAVVIVLWL